MSPSVGSRLRSTAMHLRTFADVGGGHDAAQTAAPVSSSFRLVHAAALWRLPADTPDILLDLSRLLSRLLHSTPTGVDRVEMAYAQGLLRLAPTRLNFVGSHPSGLRGRLPKRAVEDFLHLTAERWDVEGETESHFRRWRRAAGACLDLAPRPRLRACGAPRAYLYLSARGLERRHALERTLRLERARFVPFVHDLIPLEHPEYARPDGAGRYARKMATVTALASGVLCNSQATARSVEAHITSQGRVVPVRAAPLGATFHPDAPSPMGGSTKPPYFLVLATIEPRKNHLLLLHLWRQMVARLGSERTPGLVLVGRRGWENEMVLDMLDRTPSFRGVVRELSRVPDAALRSLIRNARAVLMPSFAEGYGLPVVEALALGAPVIASDLPALREAGGGAPDFLDPLDGTAWGAAILDYATPDSARRQAQLKRMADWRAPSWDDHLHLALDFVAEVCR